MACRLIGAKPLSEPMPECCYFEPPTPARFFLPIPFPLFPICFFFGTLAQNEDFFKQRRPTIWLPSIIHQKHTPPPYPRPPLAYINIKWFLKKKFSQCSPPHPQNLNEPLYVQLITTHFDKTQFHITFTVCFQMHQLSKTYSQTFNISPQC